LSCPTSLPKGSRLRAADVARYPLLFSLALALVICAIAAPGVWGAVKVQVEGFAALVPGEDLARTRDEALRDAWRRAVEVGVGLVLRAESYMANFQVLEDNIWTSASGYVKTYRVLTEAQDESFYRVTIEAEVDMLKLGTALEDLRIEIDRIGNPRVVVIAREWTFGTEQPFSVAEGALRQALLSKGFLVLDRERLAEIRDPQLLARAAEGDTKAASEVARALDADIALVGRVRAESQGSTQAGGFMWYSAVAHGDFSVVLRGTAETLSSVLAEETALGLSLEAAGTQAVEKVAESCVPQLVIETVAGLNWVSASASRVLKVLVFAVPDYSAATALQSALGSVREASQVNLRTFGQGLASFDVLYLGPAEALASDLESKVFQNALKVALGRTASLRVLSMGFDTVELELRTR
jgi:hypothetical protein